LLRSLATAGLLHETTGVDSTFVPGRPLDELSLHSILQAVRTAHGRDLSTAEDSGRIPVAEALDAVRQAEGAVASSLSLARLVEDSLRPAEGKPQTAS
jgi:DNA-binding IscR family transcriptional regulator